MTLSYSGLLGLYAETWQKLLTYFFFYFLIKVFGVSFSLVIKLQCKAKIVHLHFKYGAHMLSNLSQIHVYFLLLCI